MSKSENWNWNFGLISDRNPSSNFRGGDNGNHCLADAIEDIKYFPVNKLSKEDEGKKLTEATLGDFANIFERFSHKEAMLVTFFQKDKRRVIESFKFIYDHNLLQHCMKTFFDLNGYVKIAEIPSEYTDASEPTIVEVKCDINQTFDAYNDARVFYINEKTGGKIVIGMDYDPHQNGVDYVIFCNAVAAKLWQEWCSYSKKNNFYRGKKIDACCQFLTINPDKNWDSIILSSKTRTAIQKNIENILKHREILQKNGVQIKRGAILSGEPGVGKTLICKVLANTINASVIYVLPSHIRNSQDIGRICEMAQDLAPTLLIIEDIDWLAEDRQLHGFSGATVELMNRLDGIEDFNGVVTLATTNRCDTVEDAIKNRPGRFDRVIKIEPPDEEDRKRMLEVFLKKFIIAEDVNLDRVVKKCEKMTGAYLSNLCDTAAILAADDESKDEDNKIIIRRKHLSAAWKEIKDKDFSQLAANEPQQTMGFIPPIKGRDDDDW